MLCDSLLACPDQNAMLAWIEEAFRLDTRDATAGLLLGEELLCHLQSRSVAALREILTPIFLLLERASPAHVERGFSWICERGESDDAEAVAELMLRWSADGPQTFYTLRRFAKLTSWLLENGQAVLRSRDYALLLPFLIDVARHHLPDQVELALRYVAANEHGASAWSLGYADILWEALEMTLERRKKAAFSMGVLACLVH